MKLLKNDKQPESLPTLAGGAPEPHERLLHDAQYMKPQAAESVTGWVESWRAMSPAEFAECAERL
jgi:hypothetical protein